MARLLVAGGSGLIGAEVCRAAVAEGHETVALGRSGRPRAAWAWADRVRWVAADVFHPAAWTAHLHGCDAVVHCIGIARERPELGITYEHVNGDAAVLVVDAAERAGVRAMVYLSASARPPLLGEGYIASKRRAEREVLGAALRGVVLRPGYVYGPRRGVSLPAAALLRVAARLPVVGARAREGWPLPVERVARAALRAALDPDVRGVLDVDAIEALGSG
ncbi:MAG TPA: NAD-dependent epimerase/dehydratase family protein [Longimicrobiaceae bacterium]|nr:NAD-dependent epimerase/dehydratase family protein [Longimicrobiaceae bacterium]